MRGNFYLCVYGWMKDLFVEYYIVDNWGIYRLIGMLKGIIIVDGGIYDIYEIIWIN